MRMLAVGLMALAACHGESRSGTLLALRPACAPAEYWNGAACKPLGDAPAKIAVGQKAIGDLKPDEARLAFDDAEKAGPLDHDTNVLLWEQRALVAAYVDDEPTATSAFDMLLALDPSHFLNYGLSPKATKVFQKVRDLSKRRGAPALDVNWSRGQKVGDPIPLDVEVIADPKLFLHTATLFVRTRGDRMWRAADVALGGTGAEHRVLLPAVVAEKPVSLELYLRAFDTHGNEVLQWADATRPREIALRYDPPPPWYRKWWVIAIAGSVVALGTGAAVYELTLKPPDRINGSSMVLP